MLLSRLQPHTINIPSRLGIKDRSRDQVRMELRHIMGGNSQKNRIRSGQDIVERAAVIGEDIPLKFFIALKWTGSIVIAVFRHPACGPDLGICIDILQRKGSLLCQRMCFSESNTGISAK